jgi:AraC-like DNA-binding protein
MGSHISNQKPNVRVPVSSRVGGRFRRSGQDLGEPCMFAFDPSARREALNCAPSGLSREGAAKPDSTVQEISSGPSTIARIQDLRLRKLLELMEVDPRGNIRTWALTLNLSHSHLQHLFKQATGTALGRALTEKRLQKAAQLLANTNLRVKEIASCVGYEHTSSFTRAFERRFEHAPRRYRLRKAV